MEIKNRLNELVVASSSANVVPVDVEGGVSTWANLVLSLDRALVNNPGLIFSFERVNKGGRGDASVGTPADVVADVFTRANLARTPVSNPRLDFSFE